MVSFLDDSTMHNITEDNGKFDIIYQIPQILYSSHNISNY